MTTPKLNIDIWFYSLTADNIEKYWHSLDIQESTQANKFSNSLLKNRYIIAHGRLREVLASYLNTPAERLIFDKYPHGKPYLMEYPELSFNLSHTGNFMAVAVAKCCQLGVDIEQINPRSSFSALVKRCFSEREADYWKHLSESEQIQQFYQFWTRKEAFVKATGLGISLGLKECEININHPERFSAVPSVCGLANQWHNRDLYLSESLCAAVVADQAIADVRICRNYESSSFKTD